MLVIFGLILVALIAIVGGDRGVMSLIALAGNLLILCIAIWLIASGVPVFPVTICLSVVICCITLFYQNGINRKTLSAFTAVLITIFILFFYMYAYHPIDTGKGIKSACLAWIRTFKNSLFFRKLFCLVFFTVMILFRTLLNRNMWMNPLSDVMGGWWIWEKQSDGTVTLTTECFENIALMLPFTFLLMWTAKENLLKAKGRQICFTSILWYSTKVAFLFSLTIEFLQLFLRLGTFQLSDLCYNTLGGAIGGVLYWMGWKVKK